MALGLEFIKDHIFFILKKILNLKQKHLPRSSTERKTVAKTNLMFTFTFFVLVSS